MMTHHNPQKVLNMLQNTQKRELLVAVFVMGSQGIKIAKHAGNFSFVDRAVAKYTGAAAMFSVAKKLKRKHEITDERAALYKAAETWVDALQGRNFHGGSKPDLADLAVFGVLRPICHLQSGKDMAHSHWGFVRSNAESNGAVQRREQRKGNAGNIFGGAST